MLLYISKYTEPLAPVGPPPWLQTWTPDAETYPPPKSDVQLGIKRQNSDKMQNGDSNLELIKRAKRQSSSLTSPSNSSNSSCSAFIIPEMSFCSQPKPDTTVPQWQKGEMGLPGPPGAMGSPGPVGQKGASENNGTQVQGVTDAEVNALVHAHYAMKVRIF